MKIKYVIFIVLLANNLVANEQSNCLLCAKQVMQEEVQKLGSKTVCKHSDQFHKDCLSRYYMGNVNKACPCCNKVGGALLLSKKVLVKDPIQVLSGRSDIIKGHVLFYYDDVDFTIALFYDDNLKDTGLFIPRFRLGQFPTPQSVDYVKKHLDLRLLKRWIHVAQLNTTSLQDYLNSIDEKKEITIQNIKPIDLPVLFLKYLIKTAGQHGIMLQTLQQVEKKQPLTLVKTQEDLTEDDIRKGLEGILKVATGRK